MTSCLGTYSLMTVCMSHLVTCTEVQQGAQANLILICQVSESVHVSGGLLVQVVPTPEQVQDRTLVSFLICTFRILKHI